MPPRPTRRQVLAASAVATGGAALALGGRAATWWDQAAGAELRCLSEGEAAIVDALAEALFPPGGTPELSGKDAGVSAFFDQVMAGTPDPTGKQLRLLLHVFDDWARVARGAGYATLPLEDRIADLRSWTTSDNHLLRAAAQSLVIFVSQGYCLHPAVKEAAGWQWPCGYAV